MRNFDPLASALADVPMAAGRSPKANSSDRQQAAGSANTESAMLTSHSQAMGINSEQRKSTGNNSKYKLTIAEFASSYIRPISYHTYTAQSKPLPIANPPPAPASQVSSVSTCASTMSIDTTFDYSLFPVPPKDQPSNPGSPQPRPEQFIQQSARRPMSRIASPRQTSFSTRQKLYPGQKAYRTNSRGPGRRTSVRKSQYTGPGKPRLVGDMKNLPISSIYAKQIHVVRPTEKPAVVSVSRNVSVVSALDTRYSVVAPSEVSAVSSLGPEPPKLSVTTLVSQQTTDSPAQELPATHSPQELCAGGFGMPLLQYQTPEVSTPKSGTPPPVYIPYRPTSVAPRPTAPREHPTARYIIPEAPPAPRYSSLAPRSAAAEAQATPESARRPSPQPQESEKMPFPSLASASAPSVVGTIWPSWEEEEKEALAKKEKEKKEKEKGEKDEAAKVCPPSPSDAGTTWPPRGWGKEDGGEEEEKKKKKLDVVQEVQEANEGKVEAHQVVEARVQEEKRRYEIPDVLRIGSRSSSSLFQRLGSWDTLEVSLRY